MPQDYYRNCEILEDTEDINFRIHTEIMELPIQDECQGTVRRLTNLDWICRQCGASGPYNMGTDHAEEPEDWLYNNLERPLGKFRKDNWYISVYEHPTKDGRVISISLKKYSKGVNNTATFIARGSASQAPKVIASCLLGAAEFLGKEVPNR